MICSSNGSFGKWKEKEGDITKGLLNFGLESLCIFCCHYFMKQRLLRQPRQYYFKPEMKGKAGRTARRDSRFFRTKERRELVQGISQFKQGSEGSGNEHNWSQQAHMLWQT